MRCFFNMKVEGPTNGDAIKTKTCKNGQLCLPTQGTL